jgi:hypothetical protein
MSNHRRPLKSYTSQQELSNCKTLQYYEDVKNRRIQVVAKRRMQSDETTSGNENIENLISELSVNFVFSDSRIQTPKL